MDFLSAEELALRDPKVRQDRLRVRVVVLALQRAVKAGDQTKSKKPGSEGKKAQKIAGRLREDIDHSLARGEAWLAKAKLTDEEEAKGLQLFFTLKSTGVRAMVDAANDLPDSVSAAVLSAAGVRPAQKGTKRKAQGFAFECPTD
jgi:hypothetical protein